MPDILGLTMDNTLSLLLSCSIKVQGQNLLILKLAAVNDISKGYPAIPFNVHSNLAGRSL
jgi:hypothetical protein